MKFLSPEDNWQLKFTQINQDICDIKSNSYSSDKINNWKMTITSTQLGSTSILDNHKLPDFYNCVMGEQGDTCSQDKPLQDQTKDYNSDSQANCGILLSSTVPTPPPIPWTLPWSPALPPTPRSPLWRPSSEPVQRHFSHDPWAIQHDRSPRPMGYTMLYNTHGPWPYNCCTTLYSPWGMMNR